MTVASREPLTLDPFSPALFAGFKGKSIRPIEVAAETKVRGGTAVVQKCNRYAL